MVCKSLLISFEFQLDHGAIAVSLQAEVDIHDDPPCHIVRNIRSSRNAKASAIPAIKLMKKGSLWVHADSKKSTELSVCIGRAIDAFEAQHST